ncbi:hypothetical protein [Ornithinibacillus salinisoli]
MPTNFGANEWFVILSIVVTYTILFLLRKYFSASFTILIILFSASIARIVDHVLAGPPFDLYDIMDTEKFDLLDVFSYFLYGPFAYIFLYLYQKFNIQGMYTYIYTLLWSGLSVAYEWITVLFGVFSFKEWEPLYSFPVYLFVQSLTILFYHICLSAKNS